MLRRFGVIPSLAAALLLGCPADDDEPGGDTDGADTETGGAQGEPLALVTFNLGLAFGYVEEASGRVDPAIAAISASDADVICIQELWTNQGEDAMWTQQTIDRVLTGTAAAYPHQYWERTTAPEDAVPTGCNIEESEPLEVCAAAACGDLPPENLTDCVLNSCAEEFAAVSPGCQSCLAANLGMPLDDIVAACKGVTTSGIVYDGHNGLAVLSKHPLEISEKVDFDFALTARAALHVRVAPGGLPVDLYCTHLASDLSSSIAYPEGGAFTGFAEENAAQSAALLGWVDQTATADLVALMGDFNHGTGELPDSYQSVIAAGYSDPIAEAGVPCSFCGENTLLAGATDVDDLIDHIYLRSSSPAGGAPVVEAAAIVFNELVEIMRADGTVAQSNISDHYGVRVDLVRPILQQ